MMWFQNGKLWPSRLDAQEAMRARGEMGRRGDARQAGGFRDRPSSPRARRPAGPRGSERPEWTPKPARARKRPQARWIRQARLEAQRRVHPCAETIRTTRANAEWKPKSSFGRDRKPDWKPKGSFDRDRKPEWKPKGSFDRDRKPEWKPKGSFDRDRKPDWKPKGSFDRDRKAGWKPKGSSPRATQDLAASSLSGSRRPNPRAEAREKRAWIPKEEYKKSKGIETPRDSKWRPGGEHRDPRQKYKDAKKAKWSRFKQNIRQKWDKKQGRKKDDDK